MSNESLEQKLNRVGSAVEMLRNSPSPRLGFIYQPQFTNWQSEQQAWAESATFFDQSDHMTDVYFTGPDVTRLLTDIGTNSFRTYGRNKAKHLIACAPNGHMIGSAVLFGLEDDKAVLVGPPGVANWAQFQAETGGYDVEVVRDENSVANTGRRQVFRYEIEGPAAWQIFEKAKGGPIERPGVFGMTEFSIAGVPVRAVAHTMVAQPGDEGMGLELWGPIDDGPRVLEALLSAGEEFGMLRGGAHAYFTGSIESGYQSQPTRAIYTGEELRAYREWLPGAGFEGNITIGGSFASDDIEDYYVSPFDFGYSHLVKFDHDFIGREALEKTANDSHRKKVWLKWSDEDVTATIASSLFDGAKRAKFLDAPLGIYNRMQVDAVQRDGRTVGISTMNGYTVNIGSWASVAMVDAEDAVDGTEVTVRWGEENGGTKKLGVERHVQRDIRATVHTSAPIAK